MLNALDDAMLRTLGNIYIESSQSKIGLQVSRFSLYEVGHIGEGNKGERVSRKAYLERFRLREERGGEFFVMGELIADFVDDLPCSEEKVALDVVAVHCAMRGQRVDAASTVARAGVGELGKLKEDPIENSSWAE
jgi:hypothetical protein